MRHATYRGVDLIKRFEGFSPTPYICPGGHLTIGYGHVVKDADSLGMIDFERGDALLVKDMEVAERAVLRLIDVPLSDPQFDALVSFTYNLGAGSLQRSTLRRKANRGDHQDVPREILRWVYAQGRYMPGLVRRRRAEAKIYSEG